MFFNIIKGKQKGKRVAERSLALLQKNGVECDLVYLERKGHAEELCEQMDISGFDVIIIIGGDGTMHECVNGILKRKTGEDLKNVNLALIPAGTGKSF